MSETQNSGDKRALTLAGGKTVRVNLNCFTLEEVIEYANITFPPFEPDKLDGDEKEKAARATRMAAREAGLVRVAEFRAKASGLTLAEVRLLGYEDYALLARKVGDLIADPVAPTQTKQGDLHIEAV